MRETAHLPARLLATWAALGCHWFLTRRPPRRLLAHWYDLVSEAAHTVDADGFTCMNYGYGGDDGGLPLTLHPADEAERYPLQLYFVVATNGDSLSLRGKDVLEVGSGRGGGASFMARHLGPRWLVGLDLAQAPVSFSRARHRQPNLVFQRGDATELPFADDSFDAVVNIESSHAYADLGRFVSEVYRVLRGGGTFLIADFRRAAGLGQLRKTLREHDWQSWVEEDITRQVLRALELDSDRRRELIERSPFPALAKRALRDFAGCRDSGLYRSFARRQRVYLRYMLQTPAETAPQG